MQLQYYVHHLVLSVSTCTNYSNQSFLPIFPLRNSPRDLLQGSRLLGMWLGEDADPLDSPYCNMHNRKSMILQVSKVFQSGM